MQPVSFPKIFFSEQWRRRTMVILIEARVGKHSILWRSLCP
jgi:hypothetical protein